MSEEYIRKQDAVKASLEFTVEYLDGAFDEGLQKELKNNLESLEPADVAPVVHGKWIGYDDTERFTAQCSLCGNVVDTRFGSNFCPNCGAKMDV